MSLEELTQANFESLKLDSEIADKESVDIRKIKDKFSEVNKFRETNENFTHGLSGTCGLPSPSYLSSFIHPVQLYLQIYNLLIVSL